MSRPNYIDMMRESGVDSIISPKDITANQISAYVRAMARSEGSAVENVYKPLGGAVEAVEFTATANAKFLDTPLAELGRRLKPGILDRVLHHCTVINSFNSISHTLNIMPSGMYL